MFNKWFKVIGNSSSVIESIDCQSSIDRNSLDESDERSSIAKLVDSTPANTPFRKKAITSIERTRKLSILLRHQHYLVRSIEIVKVLFRNHRCIQPRAVNIYVDTCLLHHLYYDEVAKINYCTVKNQLMYALMNIFKLFNRLQV